MENNKNTKKEMEEKLNDFGQCLIDLDDHYLYDDEYKQYFNKEKCCSKIEIEQNVVDEIYKIADILAHRKYKPSKEEIAKKAIDVKEEIKSGHLYKELLESLPIEKSAFAIAKEVLSFENHAILSRELDNLLRPIAEKRYNEILKEQYDDFENRDNKTQEEQDKISMACIHQTNIDICRYFHDEKKTKYDIDLNTSAEICESVYSLMWHFPV